MPESPPPAEVAVELQNLHQRYAVLTDEGRATELAELFTADAVWDGSVLGYGATEGPAAIAEVITRHFDPEQPMMHLPGPLLLTAVSEDEVRGFSWCMATRWVEGQAGPVLHFHYDDVFRRDVDGVWRIARRTLRWRAARPPSA